ncbi:MAG: Crp/Fnr family transcriptional regulator [Candidatus Levybacteria bacterium]|nr:Crp/Fnr family transcriptional regulator [Candidatus Levybacteria bacterium]
MTLEEFFSKFRLLHYKKHEVIIRPGDDPPGVFFLSRGYVKVYTLSESGQELSLIIFKPGDFFPLIWAFNDVPLNQYCEAMASIEVYRSSKDEFKKFLQSNPEVLWEVTSKVLVRLRGILERMEYMVFGNAHQKVSSILVICAERFGVKRDGEILIRVPLTHRDIASLIGLTRETTSVELKKLDKMKIISKKGGFFRIKKLEKLKEEAQWYKYE